MDGERRAPSRVPEVTVYFWIIKVLTTGMGETTSDYFIHRVGLKNTAALAGITLATGAALAISLALQFRARRYVAWTYWLSLVMVSIFGTMAADGVHVVIGVPYLVSSMFFAVVLTAIFVTWYSREKTLSIHSIFTSRREAFYWMVVMATFALGTATGDMTAITLHLGYLSSGLLFAALIAVPAVGYRWFGLNGIFAFWFAYVMTRPLGASFADWLSVPASRGGLGLGWGPVSVCLTIVIVGFVGYLAVTRKDVREDIVV
ncbi:MAG: COG4705 family protein [Actinomycetota bacterium]